MDYSNFDYDTYRTRELRKYLEDAAGGKGFSNFAVPGDPTSGYLRNIYMRILITKTLYLLETFQKLLQGNRLLQLLGF